MRQTIDPGFEYDREPVVWGAVVVVVLGLLVNFVLARPGWLVPSAFVGGVVAAARSSFYDPSANNGALAATVGTLTLLPVLAVTRAQFVFGIETVGDTLFYGVTLTMAWVTVVLIVLAPIGYVGAWLTDVVRRRVGGPIGY